MTREEQIKAIYEKIADKTLSFGCVTQHTNPRNWDTFRHTFIWDDRAIRNWQVYGCSCFEDDKIIWHPVMIWDVLDYYRGESWVNVGVLTILEKWNYKRKPIEEQSDECIEFIYNLIKYANT